MELHLNKFNMVYGRDFKEISLDTFLKNINDNLDNNCTLYYYGFSNSFSVIYNGLVYDLVLDKNVMENFRIGNYNDATRKIKLLLDKIDGKIISEDNFSGAFIENEEELEIIKGVKEDKIKDSNSKKIYLEYLKKTRDNYKGFSNFLKDFRNTLFINRNAVNKHIFNNVWPFSYFKDPLPMFIGLSMTALFSAYIWNLIGLFSGNFSLLTLSLLPYASYLEFPIINLYYATKKSISRHKNGMLIDRNIMQLEQELKQEEIKFINKSMDEKKLVDDSELTTQYEMDGRSNGVKETLDKKTKIALDERQIDSQCQSNNDKVVGGSRSRARKRK